MLDESSNTQALAPVMTTTLPRTMLSSDRASRESSSHKASKATRPINTVTNMVRGKGFEQTLFSLESQRSVVEGRQQATELNSKAADLAR